ncbi:1, 4-beta cellobiohydrolase [Chaetomium sp. MPI-CAGE-AT-0009]|nr:1, 4-beta cellobiohydrolase [Chaetomium sp. MPI-CAGE-AT-0009]
MAKNLFLTATLAATTLAAPLVEEHQNYISSLFITYQTVTTLLRLPTLGWPANIQPAANLFASLYKDAGRPATVRGLATNVANYNAWSIASAPPYTSPNPNYNEKHYVEAFSPLLNTVGFPTHFITNTGHSVDGFTWSGVSFAAPQNTYLGRFAYINDRREHHEQTLRMLRHKTMSTLAIHITVRYKLDSLLLGQERTIEVQLVGVLLVKFPLETIRYLEAQFAKRVEVR